MVRPGWVALVFAGFAFSAAPRAEAEDVYVHRRVSELTIVEGRLPAPAPEVVPGPSLQLSSMEPYVVIDGEGEAYLGRELNAPENRTEWVPALMRVESDDVVAFRLKGPREIQGRLFAPRYDAPGMVAVRFKVALPAAQDDAKPVFARAMRQHYQRLISRGLPGAAWFAHQVRQADTLLAARPDAPAPANVGPEQSSGLSSTFDLFSGERAINENLQLDRPLTERAARDPKAKPERVKTESLPSITVAQVDWTARLKGKSPSLDALASSIPADQHAVFVPGLKAASRLLGEFQGLALPMAHMFEPQSEDDRVATRYERQLGVSLADLARFAGAGAIRSLALTGSDPYLRSGSDVAILIETDAPGDLSAFLTAQLDTARHAEPSAHVAAGHVEGVAHSGARSDDRRLSAYVATLGEVVVLTNSTAQLARLARTAQGKSPRLSEQAEYRFFRDRYRLGDEDEAAFVVLTDATIRRWCGPRWRIGSSRRMRAAAALAELQAANFTRLVNDPPHNESAAAPAGSIDLGTVQLTPHGARSETYGTLDFQTPILELALDEVERGEADAYQAWRDTYQANWRGVFDPIAVRVSAGADRFAADVSVIPLIVRSDYRQFVELTGKARIDPDAGDRHPESLLHAIMALDVESKLFRQGNDELAAMTRVPQQVALGWLGRSASVYLDDDPFWKDLAAADNVQTFLSNQMNRLPLGINVEVVDGVKLALFLSGLRAFVDQSAPNLTAWENREHQGQRYVRVAEAEGAPPALGRSRFVLYYFTTPRSLTVSLNEKVIQRAIARHLAKPGPSASSPGPWLGRSLAMQVSRRGFEALGTSALSSYRDQIQLRSWNNLPILNEWKRLFPDQDPVALHESFWGTRPIDPAGGRYVWNARWATMESTTFGHPGEPKAEGVGSNPLGRFNASNFGLSFEDGGLRARAEVELVGKP